MMKSFEEFQSFGKDGFEACVASSSALNKGFQTMAQEAAEFSRKSFAKESYEQFVAQMTKMNELFLSTAKEAYKPFEASMSSFSVKSPK
jgi:hypothetical protein